MRLLVAITAAIAAATIALATSLESPESFSCSNDAEGWCCTPFVTDMFYSNVNEKCEFLLMLTSLEKE